jgi:hypothetical protein
MKEIPLTQGKTALVDDNDFERLNEWKWHAHRERRAWYACHGQPWIRMHRRIIEVPPGLEIDHIDGNGLNNQRSNLRIVTTRENAQNRHTPKTSHFPGVSWHRHDKRWRASIQINGKDKHLGYFQNEEDAYHTYKTACESLKTPNSLECDSGNETRIAQR